LKTNGGDEYCGWVIKQATEELKWSPAPDVLKTIFIAGNEPFSQGTVDYKVSCKASIEKGITVNTIHCGPLQTGIDSGWKDGAVLADGAYASIDQNQKIVDIKAPQDAEISKLNIALNATYVPFGVHGKEGQANQVAQDMNAGKLSANVAAQRTNAKAGGNYFNHTWDLVDAVKTKAVKLEEVKAEDLPEVMKKMTPAERKTYVEKQTAERARIQGEIGKLNATRATFVATEMKKLAKPGEKSLEDAILATVRAQAVKQGYGFETPKKEK